MPDLLVNLLKLPSPEPSRDDGVTIRRAQPFEITPVRQFIEKNFSVAWADEVSVGFANKPVTVFIATRDQRIVGFAGYDGIGKGLLIAALRGLRELGYVYGIIGAAGPVEFYQETVGAIVIPDSEPGIYTDLLRTQ